MTEFKRRSTDKPVTERECDLRHQPLDINAKDIWEAINTLRKDVAGIYWKIGLLVGSITAVCQIVTFYMAYKK